jgi:hypothetical protein
MSFSVTNVERRQVNAFRGKIDGAASRSVSRFRKYWYRAHALRPSITRIFKESKPVFNKTSWLVPAALILSSFLGVSAVRAENPACYTLTSLQGSYAIIGSYTGSIALAMGMEYFDGNGNFTRSATVNQPLAGSTTGERTITSTSSTGTYNINCDGTGTYTRTVTNATTGAVSTTTSNFVITGAAVKNGQFVATAWMDAQQVPSTIVLGGVFVYYVHTRLPDRPGPTQP